jgi:hypothetical protein
MSKQCLFNPGDRVRVRDECKAKLLSDYLGTGLLVGMSPKYINLEFIVAPDASTNGDDISSYPVGGTIADAIYLQPRVLEKC